MAKAKFTTVGADEVVAGDRIHLTAAGTAWTVTATEPGLLHIEKPAHIGMDRKVIPFTGFTMVVRES